MLIRKIDQRIQQYLAFLDKKKYISILKPDVFVGETLDYNYTVPSNLSIKKITFPYLYGKEKYNFWFFSSFEVPETYKNEEVYLHAPTGADSLVFINGNPAGAVNPFHLKIKIADSEKINSLSVAIEAYAGHVIPGYHPQHEPRILLTLNQQITNYPIIFPTFELLIKNKDIYNLYYDILVLYDIASQLENDSLRKNEILRELYYSLIEIHFVSDQKTLEQEVILASEKIQPLLEKHNGSTVPKVYAIGHAHIDHAWLWPIGETVRKAARTFANMSRLAQNFPKFIFIQSQPAQLELIKEKYPYIFAEVVKTYQKGQWEPNGGMWVEADTNIPSGESLIRQFLIGKASTMKNFNYYGDTLWLPDVFGYSANLPQILRGCEIEYFVTSKISWNDTTRFPYDTFNWSGIDGSVVKSHFLTTSYEGFVSVKTIKESWNRVQHKDVQDSMVKPFGEGDGGGGPTRADNEVIQRITNLEGSPKTKWSKVSDSLKEIFATAHTIPTWQGELYLELHRGTYTTIANTKKYNRFIEQYLRNAEFFSVLNAPIIRSRMGYENGKTYDHELLNDLWKKLLTHQFHDIIPGSSIEQVNTEALETYKSIIATIDSLLKKLQNSYLSEIVGEQSENAILAFNSLSWEQTCLIDLPLSAVDGKGYSIVQKDKDTPCQAYTGFDNKKYIRSIVTIPPLSGIKIKVQETLSGKALPFNWKNNILETPFYKVTFNQIMQIEKICLARDDFNYVAPDQFFNTLQIAEDMPVTWDAWDIEWDTFNHKIEHINSPLKAEVITKGPLFFQLRLHYKFSHSELWQDIVFYAFDERIDFVTKVDWHEDFKVLRVLFPSTIFSDSVTCEIQNGFIHRSTLQNRDYERAMFEICAHKWIKLDDTQRGIALLNNAKYGHNVTRNQLGLTLLRSPKHPDQFADIGEHSFTYSIFPYKNKPIYSIIRKAYELNNQPIVFKGSIPDPSSGKPLFEVSNNNIIVESVKESEDGKGLIIRLYEATGSFNKVDVVFSFAIKEAILTNMLEEEKEKITGNSNKISLEFNSFEIKTLLIPYQ